MEKLKEHIWFDRRTTIRKVAADIHYTPEHLTSVLNKKTPCGQRLADALAMWSNGKFTAEEIQSM